MAYLQPAPTLIQKSGSTLHKPWGRVLVSQALTTCCDPQLSLILRHFNYGTSARFCLNTIHKNKGILVQALRYFLSSHIKEVGTLGLSWFFFFFFDEYQAQKIFFLESSIFLVNPNHRCPSLDWLTLCEFVENCECKCFLPGISFSFPALYFLPHPIPHSLLLAYLC